MFRLLGELQCEPHTHRHLGGDRMHTQLIVRATATSDRRQAILAALGLSPRVGHRLILQALQRRE
jgi:hypothetical protein